MYVKVSKNTIIYIKNAKKSWENKRYTQKKLKNSNSACFFTLENILVSLYMIVYHILIINLKTHIYYYIYLRCCVPNRTHLYKRYRGKPKNK